MHYLPSAHTTIIRDDAHSGDVSVFLKLALQGAFTDFKEQVANVEVRRWYNIAGCRTLSVQRLALSLLVCFTFLVGHKPCRRGGSLANFRGDLGSGIADGANGRLRP